MDELGRFVPFCFSDLGLCLAESVTFIGEVHYFLIYGSHTQIKELIVNSWHFFF